MWTDTELYDWTHYSGEFGERLHHVRRVRLVTNAAYIEGLIRVDWFNPVDDGTEFEWVDYYKEVSE